MTADRRKRPTGGLRQLIARRRKRYYYYYYNFLSSSSSSTSQRPISIGLVTRGAGGNTPGKIIDSRYLSRRRRPPINQRRPAGRSGRRAATKPPDRKRRGGRLQSGAPDDVSRTRPRAIHTRGKLVSTVGLYLYIHIYIYIGTSVLVYPSWRCPVKNGQRQLARFNNDEGFIKTVNRQRGKTPRAWEYGDIYIYIPIRTYRLPERVHIIIYI